MLQNPSCESKCAVQEIADVLLDQHGKLQVTAGVALRRGLAKGSLRGLAHFYDVSGL